MKNQKVSTGLGTIVLVIIAVTVGVFVWKVEKNQSDVQQPQNVVIESKPDKNTQGEVYKKPIDTSDWKVCKSEKYNYEFKYPSDWSINIPVNRTITDCNDQTSFILTPNIQTPDNNLNRVSFYIKKESETYDEFIATKKSEFTIDREFLINNRKAVITNRKGPRGLIRSLTIFDNGISYGLGTELQTSDDLFNTFVSTFNILD
jgi:hypothetical protein